MRGMPSSIRLFRVQVLNASGGLPWMRVARWALLPIATLQKGLPSKLVAFCFDVFGDVLLSQFHKKAVQDGFGAPEYLLGSHRNECGNSTASLWW